MDTISHGTAGPPRPLAHRGRRRARCFSAVAVGIRLSSSRASCNTSGSIALTHLRHDALLASPGGRGEGLRRPALDALALRRRQLTSHILFDWITSLNDVPDAACRASDSLTGFPRPDLHANLPVDTVAALVRRDRAPDYVFGSGSSSHIAIAGAARGPGIWKRMTPSAGECGGSAAVSIALRWLGLSENGDEIHTAFFDIGPFARGIEDPVRRRSGLKPAGLSDYCPPPERAQIERYQASGVAPGSRRSRTGPICLRPLPLETVY
jgi:hypothetical protein